MKKKICNLSVYFMLFMASQVFAEGSQSNLVEHGKKVFQENCASCHSYGYGTDGNRHKPAVEALQIKYQGAISPFIEERPELIAEVLEVFIRNGIKAMPPIRKTEVSDTDIEAIAAYIKHTANQTKQEK